MHRIQLTTKELHTRGGVLDRLMDSLFDAAILVDSQCNIIHISQDAFKELGHCQAVIGKHISILDSISPFEEVMKTGKGAFGLLLEIHGRKCVSNVLPIVHQGKVIGAMGTIIFRDIRKVKKIFASRGTMAKDFDQVRHNLARMESRYDFSDFIGRDLAVKIMIDKAKKAAASRLPVLIIGETGTGKEIIASAIHNSRYQNAFAPYVTINCTAIPENLLESELFGHEKGAFTGADTVKMGKFEAAAGGDILLDEIGDMSLQMQSKLLRVLESKEFERVGSNKVIPLQAGIIASTNKNLSLLSEEKKFRSDLYFRLNTIELFVPPLRQRPRDIPLLVSHFCEEINHHIRLTEEAMELLMSYS